MGRSWPSLGQSKLRFVESRGLVAQAAKRPQGGGRRAELSERAGQKTVGVSQGGGNPLGCVLCLLFVASQKVGAPAARAGERKELYSPREGWAPTGCGRPNWLTRFFARRPGSRLGGENPSKTPSGCSWRSRNAPTGRFTGHSGEKAVVEVQVEGIATPRRNRRRPTAPVITDAIQLARTVVPTVAEARGSRSALEDWAFLCKVPLAAARKGELLRFGAWVELVVLRSSFSAARLEEAAVRGERRASLSRCFASPALSVPLGTPTGGLHSLGGGWATGRTFSEEGL